MGDFISPPYFGGPQLTRKQFLAQLALGHTSVGGCTHQRVIGYEGGGGGEVLGPGALTDHVETDFVGAESTIGISDPDLAAAQADADISIASAQTGVSDATATRSSKAVALATAKLDLQPALEAEVLAKQVLYRSGHAVSILTARRALNPPTATDEQIVAAQSALDEAQVDAGAASAEVATAQAAVTLAESELHLAEIALANAKESLLFWQRYKDSLDFAIQQAHLTHLNYVEAHPPPPGIAHSYATRAVWSGADYSQGSYALARFPTFALPSTPVLYEASFISCTYQHQVRMPDLAYQQFAASGLQLKLRWCEVTTTMPPVAGTVPSDQKQFEYSSPDYFSNQVSYSERSETFGSSNAVQQANGDWLITGEEHSLPQSSPSAVTPGGIPTVMKVEIKGLPMVPMVEIAAIEFRGAERIRQGWQAFVTQEGEITPRYLTMTASTAPGAPAGTVYGGKIQLELPPYITDEPDWLEPNDYDPDLAPLIIQDELSTKTHEDIYNADYLFSAPQPTYNLSDELGGEDSGNRHPYGPDDDATVQSATVRRMHKPSFLVWTLGSPQTPQMIYDEVSEIAAQPWHDDDGDLYNSSIPGLQRAINYRSPDGDYAAKQTLRYRLNFNARDNRHDDAPFTVTFRWGLRRRNLTTGEYTLDVQSKTLTYPLSEETAAGLFEWREVSAGPQESVEVVPLRGINNDPHVFWPSEGVLAPPANVADLNPALDTRMWSFVDDEAPVE